MNGDHFKPLVTVGKRPAGDGQLLRCIMPVPPHAPAVPERHPKLGRPSATWTYRNESGDLLGYVLRFEENHDGKSFRPLTFWEGPGGREWRWESWPTPRPLYGYDRLVRYPAVPVVVCEGEKSADAAQHLLPDYIAITSPAGSKSASKADWSPLKGRDVTIWPDADAPGMAYAQAVAELAAKAGAKSVAVVTLPDGVPKGWDLGDALAEGWTTELALSLIRTAKPVRATQHHRKQAGMDAGAEDGKDHHRPRQRDQLLDAVSEAELWHDEHGTVYASIMVNGHYEHWKVMSSTFQGWVAGRFYKATGGAVSTATLTDAMRVLAVRAIEDGACHETMFRTGWDGVNCWLDLGDAAWRAVRVWGDGWEPVDHPPVRFIRSETMMALPEPEAGHLLEELRGFINASDDDYTLIVGWLVAALWGRAASYPILALGGEQGSGKSTMSRLLRSLVDPSAVAGLSPPKDERDLIVAAGLNHVLSFDNLSKIDGSLSDSLCRLSTGAGFLTRKLHTDTEASWFAGARPQIMNGIPSLTERADLADRSIAVRLFRISEQERQSEDDFWFAWERARPGIFGALLDALSAAVRRYHEVRLDRLPRMADFAKLVVAAEPGLGWEAGTFMSAYNANRETTSEAVFEADPVAVAIHRFITTKHAECGWEGTAAELLTELNQIVPEDQRRSRFWPQKVNALGSAVDRAAPALRHKDIAVEKRHTGAARLITIVVFK